MIKCSSCGHSDTSSGPRCPECGYTYRYDDVKDLETGPSRYEVTVVCKNCGNTRKNPFPEDSKVFFERGPLWQRDVVIIDEVHGERVRGRIGGKEFQFRCKVCGLEDCFLIRDRKPIEASAK